MIPSDTRLTLIDQATDHRAEGDISEATHSLFVRHLRRDDIDVRDWHRCGDLAKTGALTHHQARIAAGQLVAAGLLDRRVLTRRRRGDRQYVEYRLPLAAEGGTQ
ncbi:hypothetical protein EF903_05310 [Streptomyces sp. WAC05292]|uniref:hypothetical protein n=1 Tax=Streptomyces sp. WAC05292 TaxID=2487418 RepID=UPI000F74B6CC|nr:hypothetical protein [Streptomyces sp. WAC05292]RSS95060.1 hypothetical protein EF903_05310 [Streptomyces sp. WAC05292]